MSHWKSVTSETEGWVHEGLGVYVEALGTLQDNLKIKGNITEIGVYHGKFLLALSYFARTSEKIIAIDVFDDQDKNIDQSGVGNLKILESNIVKFGLGKTFIIKKHDSISLTPYDVVTLTSEQGAARIISVDGCHTVEHTFNDLQTAQSCLAPGGVIILDDYMQPHWPGVTEALSVFFRTPPKVKPFFYAYHKLFMTGAGWHEPYYSYFCDRFASESKFARTPSMFGAKVLTIYP